jgi:hypothetical protein
VGVLALSLTDLLLQLIKELRFIFATSNLTEMFESAQDLSVKQVADLDELGFGLYALDVGKRILVDADEVLDIFNQEVGFGDKVGLTLVVGRLEGD